MFFWKFFGWKICNVNKNITVKKMSLPSISGANLFKLDSKKYNIKCLVNITQLRLIIYDFNNLFCYILCDDFFLRWYGVCQPTLPRIHWLPIIKYLSKCFNKMPNICSKSQYAKTQMEIPQLTFFFRIESRIFWICSLTCRSTEANRNI